MIDTDKYEVAYGKWSVGHEGQHDLPEGDIPINVNGGLMAIAYSQADAELIAAAPLLLEEVKQLQAWKKLVSNFVLQQNGPHLREMLKELIE